MSLKSEHSSRTRQNSFSAGVERPPCRRSGALEHEVHYRLQTFLDQVKPLTGLSGDWWIPDGGVRRRLFLSGAGLCHESPPLCSGGGPWTTCIASQNPATDYTFTVA